MQCTNPVTIKTGINAGLTVVCGKCFHCKKAKSFEWSIRLMHECAYHSNSVFSTFTYSDEFLPNDSSLKKSEFTLAMKRLRKSLEPKRIKYYMCGEYGERFGRPHYHAIIFGLSVYDKPLLEKAWPYGIIHVGSATVKSCRYVANYMNKSFLIKDLKGREKPFHLLSNGLGKQFAIDNKEQIKQQLCITVNGVKNRLPRYYVDKILNDEDKERLKEKAVIANMKKINQVLFDNGMEILKEYKKVSAGYAVYKHYLDLTECENEIAKEVVQKEKNAIARLEIKGSKIF